MILEYNLVVQSGQNHSVSTHKRYYSKTGKKRKKAYDEGAAVDQIMQGLLGQLPAPAIEEEKYEAFIQREIIAIDPTPLMLPIIVDREEFGTAREDVNLIKKKYDWIDEEMNFFMNYIDHVEPFLDDEEKKYRFSTCLSYLKKSSPDIKKYFHSNHVANTDRLKTGFLKAAKMLQDRRVLLDSQI